MRFWRLPLFSAFASLAAADVHGDRLECPAFKGYKSTRPGTVLDASYRASYELWGEPCNAYGKDISNLDLEVKYETPRRIHVKIFDSSKIAYQVPESVFPIRESGVFAWQSALKFDRDVGPFNFNITRRGTGEVLFDTSAASIIFEDQFLRLRTKLPPNPYLYGLGEHSDPLRLETSDYIRTLWNQDSYGVPTGSNLYGSHPFYMENRPGGTHGVFLLNSNGMDVVINKTADGEQYLEYNTLGGVLDFWFIDGPSPVEVAREYADIVGKPAMQPYWSLGFHQCRYGYQDAYEVAEVVQNYSRANIPLETMWTDIDYMDRRRVFSLDPDRYPLEKMRALVSHLHAHDQRYVLMVDPAVAYQEYAPLEKGVEDDVFLRHKNGSLWLGAVWPGVSVFPDCSAPSSTGTAASTSTGSGST
ncbi:hypothetical protein CDD83_3898 [Cordyceps sp. RAO-2017]|nr:hypothetical protein CDD83_3898 [Cordyceps sp. RAO-2017]